MDIATPETIPALEAENADPAHLQIGRHFHRLIERGDLPPGTRLPTNPELARQFRVSQTVVQRALSRLTTAGLLERKPGRGTYVRSKEDKAVIATLVGPHLSDESAYFYRAMHRALQAEVGEFNWTCWVYDGLLDKTPSGEEINRAAYTQLAKDSHNYNFKALLGFHLGNIASAPMPEIDPLPRAFWGHCPSIIDLGLDKPHFVHASVEYLVKRGCRRIAYLSTGLRDDRDADQARQDKAFLEALAAFGAEAIQPAPSLLGRLPSGYEPEIHQAMLQLCRNWLRAPGNQRPDAILVDDDIVMRPVALALIQAGVRVPDERVVVTLANDQVRLYYGIPVVRYEISTREIARKLLSLLWKRIASEPLPELPLLIRGRIRVDGLG